jgi:OHCU decarboxylase
VTLDELNSLTPAEVRTALRRCCASEAWVRAMEARRPFDSIAALHAAADEEWWRLAAPDWLEAFRAHPRIGERGKGWSAEEQRGTQRAPAETLSELAIGNAEYEKRFGHVFLICATGLDAGEMLANLRARMRHSPDDELRVAAQEQARITALRLDRLLAEPNRGDAHAPAGPRRSTTREDFSS